MSITQDADDVTIKNILAQLEKILPPPLGTQNIPTEVGTRELLAMMVLMQTLTLQQAEGEA